MSVATGDPGRQRATRGEFAIAGAVAGFLAGAAVVVVLVRQGMVDTMAAGPGPDVVGVLVLLVGATVTGAACGWVTQPEALPAAVSGGLLFGLLGWICWWLTALPLVLGVSPTWSATQAGEVFPYLIGSILHGGATGVLLYLLVDRLPRKVPVPPPSEGVPPRVLVIGGGFAGVAVARRLERLSARGLRVDVTLVSESNYLLFTPMLAEVASSAIQATHIASPVRASCPLTRFRRGTVDAIDLERRVVQVSASHTGETDHLEYDQLVIALGSEPNYLGLAGVAEHSFSLKSLSDATRLRNHTLTLLDRAEGECDADERRRLLTFVVAGGGFAGVEMAAELFDFVHGVRRYYPVIGPDDPRFVLVHPRDRILPELSTELAAYAQRRLEARGIEFLLGRRVAGAGAGFVILDGQEVVGTETLVWTAGTQPNAALAALAVDKNRAGALKVDATLAVPGVAGLWAAGDCAEVPDLDRDGAPHPPTAQHALREGKALADNIAAVLRGEEPSPFRFRAIGTLVALGRRTAAAEIRGHRFSGLLAWLMWRAIYLGKLPGIEKKVRVLLDWGIEEAFPRDTVVTASAEVGPVEPSAVLS